MFPVAPPGCTHPGSLQFPSAPSIYLRCHSFSDEIASLLTRHPSHQKSIVSRVHMPNVRPYRQFDGLRLKLFRCRGTTNPAGVLSAGVLGNRSLFLGGASGKQIADAPGEGLNIFRIEFGATFGRTFPSESTSLRVRQAFLFRTLKRLLFDQGTLPFVPSSRAAKANHYCPQRRVACGASGERGVSPFKEHQVIEIGTRKTERPLCLHMKKAPLPECFTTFRADRIAHDPENNDLVAPRGLPCICDGIHDCGICVH